jgi:CRP-like cAMP-binding protein
MDWTLTSGLSTEQEAELRAQSVSRSYASGDAILRAGTVSDGIFLVTAGAAEVVANGGPGGPPAVLATLTPGAVFGELSAFAGTPAITTVVAAATPTTVTLIPDRALRSAEHGAAIRETLMRNVIRLNQERLSAANASYLRQLEETLSLLSQRHAYARLLILIIVLFGVSILVNHWVASRTDVDVYSPAFAWAYLATLGLPTAYLVRRERYPLALFGITRRGLKPDLAYGTLLTLALTGALIGGLYVAGYPVAERLRTDYLLTYGPLYAAHSALQEFMVRGVLMGLLLHVFGDATRAQRQGANVAASVMFALVHIHFGIPAVLLTFGFSLVLGGYYLARRNLAGPVLVHVVLGLVAFMLGVI